MATSQQDVTHRHMYTLNRPTQRTGNRAHEVQQRAHRRVRLAPEGCAQLPEVHEVVTPSPA